MTFDTNHPNLVAADVRRRTAAFAETRLLTATATKS
jgi:hypothetical protein